MIELDIAKGDQLPRFYVKQVIAHEKSNKITKFSNTYDYKLLTKTLTL